MKPLMYVVFLTALTTSLSWGQGTVDLNEARIFGNKDMPNITYVVPWKDEQIDAVEIKPVGSLFDDALQPIDRDVFIREIEYFDLLQDSQSTAKK